MRRPRGNTVPKYQNVVKGIRMQGHNPTRKEAVREVHHSLNMYNYSDSFEVVKKHLPAWRRAITWHIFWRTAIMSGCSRVTAMTGKNAMHNKICVDFCTRLDLEN